MLSPESETFVTPPTTPAPHRKPSSLHIEPFKPHVVLDPTTPDMPAATSPCLVHSLLNKGASLTDWLHSSQQDPADLGVAKSLQRLNYPSPVLHPQHNHNVDEDDDDFGRSLTKRLAETAVGVREMSKELGYFFCTPQSTLDSSIPRPCPCPVQYTKRPHRHKGPRQQAHQAHP